MPGRMGATDGMSVGEAKRPAARVRRRSIITYAATTNGSAASRSRNQGAWKLTACGGASRV